MTNRDRPRAFDDPIPLPGGRKLITLHDAGTAKPASRIGSAMITQAALG
jgi:hypothetical protein